MNEFKLKDLINTEAFAAPNWNGDLASLRGIWTPHCAGAMPSPCFSGTPKVAAAHHPRLADKGLLRA